MTDRLFSFRATGRVSSCSVGRTVLRRFYDGELAANASHDPSNELLFAQFCEMGRERLERFGLSSRLRGPQRQRLREAAAALESRLAELKAAVGE